MGRTLSHRRGTFRERVCECKGSGETSVVCTASAKSVIKVTLKAKDATRFPNYYKAQFKVLVLAYYVSKLLYFIRPSVVSLAIIILYLLLGFKFIKLMNCQITNKNIIQMLTDLGINIVKQCLIANMYNVKAFRYKTCIT